MVSLRFLPEAPPIAVPPRARPSGSVPLKSALYRFYPTFESTNYVNVKWDKPKTFREIEGHVIFAHLCVDHLFVYDLVFLKTLTVNSDPQIATAARNSLGRLVEFIFTAIDEDRVHRLPFEQKEAVRLISLIDELEPGMVNWSGLPESIRALKSQTPYEYSLRELKELESISRDWKSGPPNIKLELNEEDIDLRRAAKEKP
ncbi:hypothetical protein HY988_07395 [Candidatus Micrarchaeota archaeon]|nr:hypothetical protein [Candidatus Micrarchaeota archaeon]